MTDSTTPRRYPSYKARTCEVCDATYHPTYGAQRTCSRHCGLMLRWVKAGKPLFMPRLHGQHTDLVVCPVCGRRSEKKGNRVLCPPCRKVNQSAYNALLWARYVQGHPDGPCAQCGALTPKTGGGKLLCPRCRDANAKAYESGTRNHRQRARKAGVYYEPVNKWRVFERDGYRCHICGRKTSKRGGPFSPRYPTLDHLIPLAKGGPHSYANVACACRDCNTAKGAGVLPDGEQLLLVG